MKRPESVQFAAGCKTYIPGGTAEPQFPYDGLISASKLGKIVAGKRH